MIFEKYVNLKTIITLFLIVIPFAIANDCDIAKKFFSHLKGEINDKFLQYNNCCAATDIIFCNESNQITQILIQNYNLPDADFKSAIKELTGLPLLNILGILDNTLTGSIPPEIGQLTNLNKLLLCNNQLTGSIPSEIGKLNKLENLQLNNNQFTGQLPSEIGDLENLKWLTLNNNQITGSIPSEIGHLKNLIMLWLNDNQLTGSVPLEITNLNNLNYLYLENNQLNSLPTEIENFSTKLSEFVYYEQRKPTKPNNFSNNIDESKSESNSKSKFKSISEPKSNSTLIILIIIFALILLVNVIGVVAIFRKKKNNEKPKNPSNNEYDNFSEILNGFRRNSSEKSNTININRNSLSSFSPIFYQLNDTITPISNDNNIENNENSFMVDFDESLPSYSAIINN